MRHKHGAFSPDGKLFACMPDDTTIEFVDVRTGRRVGPPRKHWAYVRHLAFTPDGKSLAASYNDSTIVFWDVPPS